MMLCCVFVVSGGLTSQCLARSAHLSPPSLLAPSSPASQLMSRGSANEDISAVSYRSIYSSIEPPDARTVQNKIIYIKWYRASQSGGYLNPRHVRGLKKKCSHMA
jgi:hypothetical protein